MTDSRHDHKTVNTSLENTLIYLAPTLLIVTAIIYLVAAVMDFRTSSETERNGFRIFYIPTDINNNLKKFASYVLALYRSR